MASASNYSSILDALKTLIESVDGIGIVHKSQRVTNDWASFIEQFVKDQLVNGVTISRRSSPEVWRTNQEAERQHVFTIRLFYGVQDKADPHSEVTFQLDLVEGVCDKIREDFTFSDTCEIHSPASVRIVDYRMFGGVLCHYAEIEVTAQELLLSGS